MRIKEGFELRNICGENIVVSHGVQNINFVKVISLNESAAAIWHGVFGRDFTIEDMVSLLTAEYDVDEATALADCKSLAEHWKEIGFLEI